VAVHDGARVLAHATTVDARRQGELLASHIEKVLARAGVSLAELTAIVAGVGPGPYTGLRTGLVTARVLGAALGIDVHGWCTLDVIASDAVAAAAGPPLLVGPDAWRREVSWARYSPAGGRLSGPGVAAPASLPAGLPTAGEGAVAYPGLLGEPIAPRFPSAATLAGLAAQRLAAQRLAAQRPTAGRPAGGDGLLPPGPLYPRRPPARGARPPPSGPAARGPAPPGGPRAAP